MPWALFYPADYSIGSASLGYQYVFQTLREIGAAAERFFASPVPYRSADADTMLERFPVITASIAYECDLPVFFRWLRGAGIPSSARGARGWRLSRRRHGRRSDLHQPARGLRRLRLRRARRRHGRHGGIADVLRRYGGGKPREAVARACELPTVSYRRCTRAKGSKNIICA